MLRALIVCSFVLSACGVVLGLLTLSACSTPYITPDKSLNNAANLPYLADRIEAEEKAK